MTSAQAYAELEVLMGLPMRATLRLPAMQTASYLEVEFTLEQTSHPAPCPCVNEEGGCTRCPACGYCECEVACSCAAYGHGGSSKGPCWRES